MIMNAAAQIGFIKVPTALVLGTDRRFAIVGLGAHGLQLSLDAGVRCSPASDRSTTSSRAASGVDGAARRWRDFKLKSVTVTDLSVAN